MFGRYYSRYLSIEVVAAKYSKLLELRTGKTCSEAVFPLGFLLKTRPFGRNAVMNFLNVSKLFFGQVL